MIHYFIVVFNLLDVLMRYRLNNIELIIRSYYLIFAIFEHHLSATNHQSYLIYIHNLFFNLSIDSHLSRLL